MPQVLPAPSKERHPNVYGMGCLLWVPVAIRPEERMVSCLGGVCKTLREAEGFKESKIAGILDVRDETVRNFEAGNQWPTKTGVEETLDVYVEFCAVDSRLEIWEMAIAELRKAATRPAAKGGLSKTPIQRRTGRPKRRRAS